MRLSAKCLPAGWNVLVGTATLALVAGCASLPLGPSVMALPGTGKSFDQFRLDDQDCRNYALAQVGGESPNAAASGSGVTSAVVGTALGAAAGAALGGGQGAGIGAGAGLLVGSAGGQDASQASADAVQRQYDHAYLQCMYAKGERVPMPAGYSPFHPTYIQSNPVPPSPSRAPATAPAVPPAATPR